MNRITSFVPLIGAFLAPIAFAQPSPLPQSAPQVSDVARILAQTFSEQDIELIAGTMRDALQGKQIDPARMLPLTKKMEGLSATLFREMLAIGLPAITQLEAELKRELHKQKSGQ